MMKEILHNFWNELRMVSRDEGIIIFVILAPLFYPILYTYTYTNEAVREVPCAVVNDSHSALSRESIRHVDATPNVDIHAQCHNMDEATLLLKRRDVAGILHIPSTYGMDGYARISSLGANLLDVSREYFALWTQAIAYFLLTWWLYQRNSIQMKSPNLSA